jgi:hypothetical protein
VAEASDERYRPLLDVVQFLRGLGLFMKVKRAFDRAVFQALIAGAVAAAGIGLFAYETSHKPKPKKTHTTTLAAVQPSVVKITFSAEQKKLLATVVRKGCARAHRRGLAIGGTPDRLDVIVLPTHHCGALRLTFTPDHGLTLARRHVLVKQK